MNPRVCLDKTCPMYLKPVYCERKQFHLHVLKKSTETLIAIFNEFSIVKFPEKLNRLTLVNLLTDFSMESLANMILHENTHKNGDFYA